MQRMVVDDVRRAVEQGIEDHLFPGAVVHVVHKGEEVLFEAFGHAELVPQVRELQKNFLFDIASLTKVTATLPALLRSVQMGKLSLTEPLTTYLTKPNQADHDFLRTTTLLELLSHTSGLPAWRPFYLQSNNRSGYMESILRESREYEIGSKVVYSDIGFLLAGFLLEEVWQQPLDQICSKLVFTPLEMDSTMFKPLGKYPSENIVATESGNEYEKLTCLEFASNSDPKLELDVQRLPWRQGTICGEVHDGNSYYGLGGISGHAGLFSTAHDLARYMSVWRNQGFDGKSQFLDQDLVRFAVTNHTPLLNQSRGLGLEVAPTKEQQAKGVTCSAGPSASEGAFGHTGFTGTSMWYDPFSDTQVIALTNRVHPAAKDGMPGWRRLLHAAVFSRFN